MSSPFAVMLISFATMMMIGIPLSFTLILSGILYFVMAGLPLYLVAQQFFNGMDIFTIMAIPFFMLAGDLLVASGTADRLVRFALLLVGRLRGGMGYVNVVNSFMFGGCSGSAVADVAALGRMEVRMMETNGFRRDFAAALTCTTATMGAILPPSIPMVLVGAVTGTSIGGMLMGGLVPGILMGLALSLVVFLGTRGHPQPERVERSWKEAGLIVLQSIPFMIMPVIIMGGILTGSFTPTEAAASAVAWGFVLLFFNARGRVDPRALFRLFARSGTLAAAILLMAGASNIFSWILATEQVPVMIADAVFRYTDNRYVVLLLINILLLIWGAVMDMLPAIFIIIPILMPLAVGMGIDPVHFGVVVTFNLIIGLITPPYGAVLFAGSIVLKMPIERMTRPLLPMVAAAIAVLMLITYVPETVLYMPRLMGLLN